MNKFLTVVLAVAIVIATTGLFYPKVIAPNVQPLGSVVGPDSTFECTSQNGLQTCKTRQPLATATTTVCAVRSPSATSTLVSTALQVHTSTSTAVTLTVATSTSAFATTTVQNTFSLASGATGSFSQTPTTTARQVMGPNQFVVWSATGFMGGDSTKFLGTCYADFKVI